MSPPDSNSIIKDDQVSESVKIEDSHNKNLLQTDQADIQQQLTHQVQPIQYINDQQHQQ